MSRMGLAPMIDYEGKYSTLFCPAGFEFYEPEENIVKNSINQKGLLESEYLQFYIPKTQITGIYKNQSNGDLIMAHPEINTQSDENVMLEVWCKVFHVRELSTNINI